MKKRKFSIIVDIAVISLCLCAIVFGVYSAKNATLNVGGTVGFNAHDCKVRVYGQITGAVDANNVSITDETTTAHPFFREGDTGEVGKLVTDKANNVWDFGTIYFDDLSGDNVRGIVFTFKILNESEFDVLLDIPQHPTLPDGFKSDCKIDGNTSFSKMLKKGDTTPTVYVLTLSLADSDTSISDLQPNIKDLSINFSKANNETKVTNNSFSVSSEQTCSPVFVSNKDSQTRLVDVVFGSDTGKDDSDNSLVYSGDITVPQYMDIDGEKYLTNNVYFKDGDFFGVTSITINAISLPEWFGGVENVVIFQALKNITLFLENLEITDETYQTELTPTGACGQSGIFESLIIKCKNNLTITKDANYSGECTGLLGEFRDSPIKKLCLFGYTINTGKNSLLYSQFDHTFDCYEVVAQDRISSLVYLPFGDWGFIAKSTVIKNITFMPSWFFVSVVSGAGGYLEGNQYDIDNVVDYGVQDIGNYTSYFEGENYYILYDKNTNKLLLMADFESVKIPKCIKIITSHAFGNYTFASVTYEGTIDEWNEIVKENNWNNGTKLKTIICSDGTITL